VRANIQWPFVLMIIGNSPGVLLVAYSLSELGIAWLVIDGEICCFGGHDVTPCEGRAGAWGPARLGSHVLVLLVVFFIVFIVSHGPRCHVSVKTLMPDDEDQPDETWHHDWAAGRDVL
jgi:hypothetical protein